MPTKNSRVIGLICIVNSLFLWNCTTTSDNYQTNSPTQLGTLPTWRWIVEKRWICGSLDNNKGELLFDSDTLSICKFCDTLLKGVAWHHYRIYYTEDPNFPKYILEDYEQRFAPYHSYVEVYGKRYYLEAIDPSMLAPSIPPYNMAAFVEDSREAQQTTFSIGFYAESSWLSNPYIKVYKVDTSKKAVFSLIDHYWYEERMEQEAPSTLVTE